MKIEFYFDWLPGMDMQYCNANTKTYGQNTIPGAKRYKFIVEIDDPNEPDESQEVVAELEKESEK